MCATFDSDEWDCCDDHTLCRIVGGRRSYNRWRQAMAAQRRYRLMRWMRETDARFLDWGLQSRAAKEFGVHRCTICRDIKYLFAEAARLSPAQIDRLPGRSGVLET